MPQSNRSKQNNTAILSGSSAGGIAIITAQTENESQLSSERTSWNHGRTERASSSPACCRQRNEYPPGYTVFECRLDGNQPIAQVVQVPPDTRDTALRDKTCVILETKQSEFGPSSRVAAYPGRNSTRSASPGLMSFALEARDRPDGAVACARQVAEHPNPSTAYRQPVTTLETTKGAACEDGPSSTLTYGPVSDGSVPSVSRNYKPPALYIQCSTTAGGSVARVTRVPQDFRKNSGDTAMTRYETFVNHDGSCPIATATRANEKAASDVGQACEYLETRVCPSGPRARALTFPDDSSNFRHFTDLNVKPRENGPSARITQQPGDPQKLIPNVPDNRRDVETPTVCCREPISRSAAHICSPCGLGNARKTVHERTPCVGRRNGLTPTTMEMNCRAGPFGCDGLRKQRTNEAQKPCQPSGVAEPTSPYCRVQPAPCAKKKIQVCEERSKSPVIWPTPCVCPPQSSPKPLEHPCFEQHPLPGGCLVSQRPIGFRPDITPVDLGPNRLRDSKPLPKTARPRKGTSSTRRKPTVVKSNKPAKSSQKKTTKKTKNKMVPPEKSDSDSAVSQLEKGEASPEEVPCETYVECPAFASKESQSDPVQREPVYVQCPEYEENRVQSCNCKESSRVQPSSHDSKRKQSFARVEEPSYVRCSAFERKTSSGSSSEYMARANDSIRQCPEYCRAKTVETFLACRVKRNGLRDERHFYIPDSVHRGRNAKHRGPNHQTDHRKHRSKAPASDGEKEIEQHGKHDEHDSSDAKRTKHALKAVNSRELRAGVVYHDCDCYHRNGLQHDCPRSRCGGLNPCVTKPWPSCSLSQYFTKKWGKYEELLDLIPPTAYCGRRDAFYRAKMAKMNHSTAEESHAMTDKCSEKRANDKSVEKDKTGKVKRYASQKQRTAKDGKYSKSDDNLVREYAMIRLSDANNHHRSQ